VTGSPQSASGQPGVVCGICAGSIPLETCKTDERGNAVHEDCYARITISRFRMADGHPGTSGNWISSIVGWAPAALGAGE